MFQYPNFLDISTMSAAHDAKDSSRATDCANYDKRICYGVPDPFITYSRRSRT